MKIAALPMYDLPELRQATDALWSALASRLAKLGVTAPASLLRGPPLDDIWTDPDLLLGQTCGYPLVTSLAGKVSLLATPCYSAPGCDGARYRSAIIVRASDPAATIADLRGRRCAINQQTSNSGMNLLRAAIAPLARGTPRYFTDVIVTGAHTESVRAVAGGAADVAAIDCVTWAHLQHLRPFETNTLRVLAWTGATPGLPLITSLQTGARIRSGLLEALRQVASDAALLEVRSALRLDGFVTLPLSAYEVILELEQRANATGYVSLR